MVTPLRAVPRLRCAAALRPARPAVFSFPLSSAIRRRTARAYSSSTAPSSGLAPLSSRRLISVAGPDAAKYLQGVVTASILRLSAAAADNEAPTHTGLYTAFLSAQGRVLHDVFVYRDTLGVASSKTIQNLAAGGADGGAYLIEVDADEAATLAQHIKRYKLRAKFDVRLLDAGELTVWHGWGHDQAATAAAAAATGSQAIVHADTRAPGLGWRYVSAGALPTETETPRPPTTDETAYRVHRYRLGVAEGQREILRSVALPLESNMDLMGGIDYHKGCYVGQELTIRTKHRGVVRKRILPCVVYADGDAVAISAQNDKLPPFDASGPAASVPPETSIGRVGKKGRSAGKWLAGVGNMGLALCRLETMTDVVLPDEAAAAAASAAATCDPASEFVLNIKSPEDADAAPGPPLKVKAIVPAWLRQGLAPAA